ncbi:MAG: DUF4332 domain-containing protein [Cyanobacteria bacterium J06626_23]
MPPAAQQQLQQIGIVTTGDLIRRGQTPSARLALARELNSHPQYLNKWTALARLAALPSVGLTYCGLLLHAGISSPEQLAQFPINQLHQQLQRLQIKLLSQATNGPDTALISQWIREARTQA